MRKTSNWISICLMLLTLNFAVSCGSGIQVNTEDEGATATTETEEQANTDETTEPDDTADETPPAAVEKKKIMVAVAANLGDPIGTIATIELDGTSAARTAISSTDSGDAVVRTDGEYIYIVNRMGGDSIQVFDPNNDLEQLADYSVGPMSNPYDIEIVGERAYISRYDSSKDTDTSDVLIVNRLTGKKIGGLDLRSYMADDGAQFAYASQMAIVGKNIYVACQDLPGNLASWWVPDTNGKVVVIDTDTDNVIANIELEGWNPNNIIYSEDTGKLYITDTGTYDTTDSHGGIEVIDAATNTSEGIRMDDAVFGSALSELRIASKDLGYVIATPFVASFDPTNFTITKGDFYTSNYVWFLPEFELLDNGAVAVADVDMTKGGIYMIDKSGTIEAGPISVGATPYSIEVVEVIKK